MKKFKYYFIEMVYLTFGASFIRILFEYMDVFNRFDKFAVSSLLLLFYFGVYIFFARPMSYLLFILNEKEKGERLYEKNIT